MEIQWTEIQLWFHFFLIIFYQVTVGGLFGDSGRHIPDSVTVLLAIEFDELTKSLCYYM